MRKMLARVLMMRATRQREEILCHDASANADFDAPLKRRKAYIFFGAQLGD